MKQPDKWTPLDIAAAMGYVNVIKILLPLVKSSWSETNYWPQNKEQTPIGLAATFGHLEALKLLLNYKFGSQSMLHTPIIDDAIAKAKSNRHSHIVNYLKFGKL